MSVVAHTIWREHFRSVLIKAVSRAMAVTKGCDGIGVGKFLGASLHKFYLQIVSDLDDDTTVKNYGTSRFESLFEDSYVKEDGVRTRKTGPLAILRSRDPELLDALKASFEIFWPMETARRRRLKEATPNSGDETSIDHAVEAVITRSDLKRLMGEPTQLLAWGEKRIVTAAIRNDQLNGFLIGIGLGQACMESAIYRRSPPELHQPLLEVGNVFLTHSSTILLSLGEDPRSIVPNDMMMVNWFGGMERRAILEAMARRCGYPPLVGNSVDMLHQKLTENLTNGRGQPVTIPTSKFYRGLILTEAMRTTDSWPRRPGSLDHPHSVVSETRATNDPWSALLSNMRAREAANELRKWNEVAEHLVSSVDSDLETIGPEPAEQMYAATLEMSMSERFLRRNDPESAFQWLEKSRRRMLSSDLTCVTGWSDWFVVCALFCQAIGHQVGEARARALSVDLSTALGSESYRVVLKNSLDKAETEFPSTVRPIKGDITELVHFLRHNASAVVPK